ncbi:uncharacterized protein [Nicotiana sylvestris]|uniref:uncharacterized protein n=1 Tax=Nicotiana sylvestris TaxID=4096 RepID=UPI00388CA401
MARPEAGSSHAIITGIVPVFYRDALVLFDPGSTYSYMSSHLALYLVVPYDSLSAHMFVSMHVGDSIVVDRVYHSCVITIGSLETSTNLLLLDMVDFNVILGMDLLSLYHAILDYRAKTARRMVEKGCLAYLAYIRDSNEEIPSMDSVLVVLEFPEVFPADMPGMPPNRDIDFCIDLAPGTQPIFIPPYCMATPELNELKDQLHDFLDKGFIRPSVSPRGAPVLFLKKKDGSMRKCINYQ